MHSTEKGKEGLQDDCTCGKAKVRSGKERPFAIEHRIHPEKRTPFGVGWFSVWHVCKRYETAERRDAALVILKRKDRFFEYRVAE